MAVFEMVQQINLMLACLVGLNECSWYNGMRGSGRLKTMTGVAAGKSAAPTPKSTSNDFKNCSSSNDSFLQLQSEINVLLNENSNLRAEKDQANVTIANLQSQLANLTTQLESQINTSNITGKYPSVQLLLDVRRSPTPAIKTYSKVTYDEAMINIDNCMDIKTGIFTAPIDGTYYCSWTGPNGEFIPRQTGPTSSYLKNNHRSSAAFNSLGPWDDQDVKTHRTIRLKKGDVFYFYVLLRARQYEKCVCYYLG